MLAAECCVSLPLFCGSPRCRDFFNVHDGVSTIDPQGTELRDIYEAQSEAVMLSGELLREVGGKFWEGGIWKVDVCDEKGQLVFTLSFTATEQVKPTQA